MFRGGKAQAARVTRWQIIQHVRDRQTGDPISVYMVSLYGVITLNPPPHYTIRLIGTVLPDGAVYCSIMQRPGTIPIPNGQMVG